MPPFEKSPPELAARFDAAAERAPEAHAALDGWLARAIGFGKTLPAK